MPPSDAAEACEIIGPWEDVAGDVLASGVKRNVANERSAKIIDSQSSGALRGEPRASRRIAYWRRALHQSLVGKRWRLQSRRLESWSQAEAQAEVWRRWLHGQRPVYFRLLRNRGSSADTLRVSLPVQLLVLTCTSCCTFLEPRLPQDRS